MERSSDPPFRLAAHVRACRVNNQVVILDLRRDKYIGVGSPEMHELSRFIANWPRDERHARASAASVGGNSAEIMERLRADRVIISNVEPHCAQPAPVLAHAATRTLLEGYHGLRPALTSRDVIRLVRAVSYAKMHLRRHPIERTMMRIRAQRMAALRPTTKSSSNGSHCEHVQTLMAKYLRACPWLFGARKACLLDSIALSRFLSFYDVHPLCVIGVRTHPFSAHCWLQMDDVVINDSVAHVRGYEPLASF